MLRSNILLTFWTTIPDTDIFFLAFCIKILNLAGFRKVLKKYVKITNIPILDAYMKQKVRNWYTSQWSYTQALHSCRWSLPRLHQVSWLAP